MWPSVRVAFQETGHKCGFICYLLHVGQWDTPRRSQEVPSPGRQVSVSCKGTMSLPLSLIFVQYFVSTNANTVHHDKKKGMYCCSQACNGVAQGLLSWCGGGRYRFESSMIKEWNLSPRVIQGHTDFQRKDWLLPFPVLLKFFKKGYGHVPSEEECMDCRAGVGNTVLLQTQEKPPTRLTPRVTYWIIQR